MADDGVKLTGRKIEFATFLQSTCDGGRIANPSGIVNEALLVLRELTEIIGSRHPALIATLGLIIDVEGAVVVGKHHGLQALAGSHNRIILWPPGNEVLAVGSSKHRTSVVDLEHQSPRAIHGTRH